MLSARYSGSIFFVTTVYDSMTVSREIRQSVARQGLKDYLGGPGKDYRNAKTQYAVSVLLLDNPVRVNPDTKALLVTRNNGKKTNVSGFADIMSDPAGKVATRDFDIVVHAALAELWEECGLPSRRFSIRPGGRFIEMVGGATRHILTVGAYYTGERPQPKPDGKELLACDWVPLRKVRETSDLSPGYLNNTLPCSLMAYGLSLSQARRLIGLPKRARR